MKVLLDECLPRKLKSELCGHDVSTVPEMGWGGTKNGALLSLAQANFDVVITADQNMQYQQNLRRGTIRIIVLVAPNNRLDTLRSLFPDVLRVIDTMNEGELVRVGA